MAEGQSAEELQQNLAEYRSQQEQVEQLLLSEPENQEYAEIYRSLTEAIELTEELLKETAPGFGTDAGPSKPAAKKVVTEAPHMHLPSILPPQVAQQIRSAQQKAALSGQAPEAWAIGGRCQAYSSLDGSWYTATVTGVSAAGHFVVQLDQGGPEEEIEKQRVRVIPDELETYRGVTAPIRKAVADKSEEGPVEIPKWLEIKSTDSEKTKNKKKKLQKSLKSKMRFQRLDQETNQRQAGWLDFRKGKGAKKKAGFLSTGKKASIFSVPENPQAKVGVVGSGKGMTDYKTNNRHDFAAE